MESRNTPPLRIFGLAPSDTKHFVIFPLLKILKRPLYPLRWNTKTYFAICKNLNSSMSLMLNAPDLELCLAKSGFKKELSSLRIWWSRSSWVLTTLILFQVAIFWNRMIKVAMFHGKNRTENVEDSSGSPVQEVWRISCHNCVIIEKNTVMLKEECQKFDQKYINRSHIIRCITKYRAKGRRKECSN